MLKGILGAVKSIVRRCENAIDSAWNVVVRSLKFVVILVVISAGALASYVLLNPELRESLVNDLYRATSSPAVVYQGEENPLVALYWKIKDTAKFEFCDKNGKIIADRIYNFVPGSQYPDFSGERVFVEKFGVVNSTDDLGIIPSGTTEVMKIYVRLFRVPNSTTESWFGKSQLYMLSTKDGMKFVNEPTGIAMMMAQPPQPCNTNKAVWEKIERLRKGEAE